MSSVECNCQSMTISRLPESIFLLQERVSFRQDESIRKCEEHGSGIENDLSVERSSSKFKSKFTFWPGDASEHVSG